MDPRLRDRVRELLGRPAAGSAVAELRAALPQPAPGVETVRFVMHCSVHGEPFVVVAERRGDTLKMLRNELPGRGGAGGAAVSGGTLGEFRCDSTAWPGCGHCGARDNQANPGSAFWWCEGAGCGRPFHCMGNRAGVFRCACGKTNNGSFTAYDTVAVRGLQNSTAPAAGRITPTPATPALRAPAPRPALDAPPAAPRLPWKR